MMEDQVELVVVGKYPLCVRCVVVHLRSQQFLLMTFFRLPVMITLQIKKKLRDVEN